jgi:hypothetical protein
MKLVKPVVKTLSWRGWHRSFLLVGFVLSGSSPGNTCSNEAASHPKIDKKSQAGHAFYSSLSGLEGFATMPVLRMGGSSLY